MMKRFLFQTTALRAPAGEGGGGGGGGEGGGQQQNNQSGQQQQNNQGGQQQQNNQNGQQQGSGGSLTAGGQPGGQNNGQGAQPYRPEGLPDHLVGKDERETIDKLYGAVKGFREQQGDRGAVPKTPNDYKLEASDKLKPYVANFDKDPVFTATRDIFHKAGITDKQFNAVVGPWLEKLIEGGLVDAPVDAKAQLRSLAPAAFEKSDDATKEAEATKRMNNNLAWVDVAKAQGLWPAGPDGKSEIADFFAAALTADPRAHKAVEWLRGQNAEPRPALNGGQNVGGVSQQDVLNRQNDPRNDPRNSKYEKAFAVETDRLSKMVFGD